MRFFGAFCNSHVQIEQIALCAAVAMAKNESRTTKGK
jgi:hypothetical protein